MLRSIRVSALGAELAQLSQAPRVYAREERDHILMASILWAAPDATSLDCCTMCWRCQRPRLEGIYDATRPGWSSVVWRCCGGRGWGYRWWDRRPGFEGLWSS